MKASVLQCYPNNGTQMKFREKAHRQHILIGATEIGNPSVSFTTENENTVRLYGFQGMEIKFLRLRRLQTFYKNIICSISASNDVS